MYAEEAAILDKVFLDTYDFIGVDLLFSFLMTKFFPFYHSKRKRFVFCNFIIHINKHMPGTHLL